MFFNSVKQALLANRPNDKISRVNALYADLQAGKQLDFSGTETIDVITVPGRPRQPELVPPGQVARRKLTTPQGRVALIHALCHIEFNAINLALDALYRFQSMPEDYYADWLRVAAEEAEHFLMLRRRLQALGSDYGALTAHNGLWEMALKTRHSVLERMALVPRVLEARGLDVTPGMVERLTAAGDVKTVAILKVILRDEIGHVETGTRWFRYACDQQNKNSEDTFLSLLRQYDITAGRGPLHTRAREQAGFSAVELAALS